jgi:hypothetical protein
MKILGYTVTEEQKERIRARMQQGPFSLCEIASVVEGLGFPRTGDVAMTLADCMIQRESAAGNIALWTLARWIWVATPDSAHG